MSGVENIYDWVTRLSPGKSFVDIGGIGSDARNERATTAALAGASRVALADVQPFSFKGWPAFRAICSDKGVRDVVEFERIDVRSRSDVSRLGRFDIVHCTGILYHVPSPADVVWNLRRITGKYLITNTVTLPNVVENEYGRLSVPDCCVVFCPALSEGDRSILEAYYKSKFPWGINYAAPRLDDEAGMKWIEGGELTCWPYWYLYTDHAFRSVLSLCKLRIVDEFKWKDHSLQVLCEKIE